MKTQQSDHNEIQNHHNSNCKIQSMREKQQNTSILSTADCKEVSYLDKHSRTGRSRLISGHNVRTRSREPSRIPIRKVVRLFKKSKSIRKSVRLYIRNYVPQSSKLKSLLCTYYRNYTFERQTNMLGKLKQKTVKSCNYGVHCYSNMVLNLCVVQTRTAKHKNAPLLCILYHVKKGESTMEYNQQQRLCASRRKLLISGVIELNPGPFAQSDSSDNSAFASKNTPVSANPSVSLLVSRLAALGLRLLDVGGGGNCFFRAVSHQIYGTQIIIHMCAVWVLSILESNQKDLLKATPSTHGQSI